MVEITVTCDACGEVMSTVDASDCLCVESDSGWHEVTLIPPRYSLALRPPVMLFGIREWATYMYDGREHLLCSDCAEELSEMVSKLDDDRERVIREFFGDV